MKMNKVGNYSSEALEAKEKQKEKEEDETARALTMKVGSRCETTVPKQPKRRGVIMYIG